MKSPSGVDRDIPVSNSLTTTAVIDLSFLCPLPLVYTVTEPWIFCKNEQDCGVFYAGCANGSSPQVVSLSKGCVWSTRRLSSLLTACLSLLPPAVPIMIISTIFSQLHLSNSLSLQGICTCACISLAGIPIPSQM